MPRREERKTTAHTAPGRMEDRCTYRSPHWTERKTSTYEGNLPHILQSMQGMWEDDKITQSE